MDRGIKWNVVRITVPYNLGMLNDKKVEVLTQQLNENEIGVNARINGPDGSAVFVLCQGRDNLILAPNQFTYISSIDNNSFEWENLKNKIMVILDALLIDNNLKYVFNFEGSREAVDSHNDSCKQYTEKFGRDVPGDVFGIGYRFLIKNENFEGDYKVEPLINDRSKWYYQLILNTINSSCIDYVISKVSEEIEKQQQI